MLNKGTYNDAVLENVWGLNPGPPALEASTIPLGYRGGGIKINDVQLILDHIFITLSKTSHAGGNQKLNYLFY